MAAARWFGRSHTQRSYLRPLGKNGPVLLLEEVEQLVLLVQGHHFADGLVVLFFLLQHLEAGEGEGGLGGKRL